MSKEETEYRAALRDKRRAWFDKTMTKAGVDTYGRASRISREIGCSIASVQSWISGNLPKDGVLLHKCAHHYGFDMAEWVTTEKQSTPSDSEEHWLEAIKMAKDFEDENGILSAATFQSIVVIIRKHLKGNANINDSLAGYAKVLEEAKKEANGV